MRQICIQRLVARIGLGFSQCFRHRHSVSLSASNSSDKWCRSSLDLSQRVRSNTHQPASFSLSIMRSFIRYITTFASLAICQCMAVRLSISEQALAKRQQDLPDYAARNLDTIRRIYNLTVYPNNAQIVNQGASAVPPGLFNNAATGRVSPVGNFSGFEDSIEYFFALAPTPQAQQGLGIYRADVVEFTSGCAEVAASLVYLRTGKVDPETGAVDKSQPTSTLSQVAFWRFDDQGQVLKYHVSRSSYIHPSSKIDTFCRPGSPTSQHGPASRPAQTSTMSSCRRL